MFSCLVLSRFLLHLLDRKRWLVEERKARGERGRNEGKGRGRERKREAGRRIVPRLKQKKKKKKTEEESQKKPLRRGGKGREQQEATEMAAGMLSQPARGEEFRLQNSGIQSDAERCEAVRPGCHEPYSLWVPAGQSEGGSHFTPCIRCVLRILHTTPASSQSAPARASSGGQTTQRCGPQSFFRGGFVHRYSLWGKG